jgi:tight adherence protein B
MLSSSVFVIPLIFVLSAGCVGAILLVGFYPQVVARSAFRRRVDFIAVSGQEMALHAGRLGESHRKRSVEATLREVDERQKSNAKRRAKYSLSGRLRQANIGWSPRTYYLVSLCIGIGGFLIALTSFYFPIAIGLGVSAGMLIPHLYLKFRRNRRFKLFLAEFPNAIDVIVRGIKAGLPLVDCLKIVAAEAQEPVKSEFKSLSDDQALGMPLDEAVQRIPQRIPLPEARFFAIVIAIQSRTGGNLSEALGNLSKVLRERKKMQQKVKAMSGEAKASAMIIGSLPVAVAGLLALASPHYIALLFITQTGNLVLVGCAVLMLIGILVMRKMINFEL